MSNNKNNPKYPLDIPRAIKIDNKIFGLGLPPDEPEKQAACDRKILPCDMCRKEFAFAQVYNSKYGKKWVYLCKSCYARYTEDENTNNNR